MAIWAVAYALVFQLLLPVALIAAQPRGEGAPVICFAGTELQLGGLDKTGGSEAPLGVHCQACLARVDLAAMPPPVAMPHPERVAVAFVFPHYDALVLRVAQQRLPVQPRAPPVPA